MGDVPAGSVGKAGAFHWFVTHVPDQVHLKAECEIEGDGTELEIELTW